MLETKTFKNGDKVNQAWQESEEHPLHPNNEYKFGGVVLILLTPCEGEVVSRKGHQALEQALQGSGRSFPAT